MNQYRDNYEEVENQSEQQIYEFSEYPQIKEYYSNKINTSVKKPKKIIVTEIFDQNPQSRNGLKLNKAYYKYYTETNSPYHYNQKNSFYQNRIGNNYLTQMNESCYNLNNNVSEGYYSDYNKYKTYNSHKNMLYNSCLREEYSSPTNDRVNIRKKIYRGSQTPQPYRNNYNIKINNFRNEENSNEPLIENFKYYEINNIKDRSNKKYNSITRVTGYSNLIPLHRRQIFYNDSRNIDMYRNNYINKSYNVEYNDSIINPSTTKEIKRVEIEKKEYNIPHINSQIKEKIKEYNNIKIQRKRKEEDISNKEEKRKEFVIPPRKKTNEIKKASTSYTKIQKTTISTNKTNDSLNAYKRRNENNQSNTKNNLTSKNNTSIGQYQYKKRTKELNNTSRNNKSSININLKNTNNTSSNYSKYQRKSKELNTTKSSSNIGSYKYQTKINTENNLKNNDKVEYRKHTGRYKYKTDIDKDILDSRKNYSQSKNVNKIEVVHQNKEKEKKHIQNRDNNTSSKVSSYQKTTKTSTSNYKNNNVNNYKNSSTNKYKNTSISNYKNSSTNNYKNNINKVNNTNNSGNYKKRNDNYSSSRLIKETKIATTTTTKTNINNMENKRKNTSSYKGTNHNINANLDANKSIYNKYKYKLSQKVETNVSKNNNFSSNKNTYNKSGNNENIGFIESNIVENRVYELPENELQNKSSIKKMKMNMRKISLGDNYKYYESKFLLNPIDNSYTLHQRRNERVIYGNVPTGVNKIEIFKKKQPQVRKYKDKKNKIIKRTKYPNLRGEDDNYEIYNKYILNNYSYNNGYNNGYNNRNEIGFQDGYENVEEINNYEQEHIYYQ